MPVPKCAFTLKVILLQRIIYGQLIWKSVCHAVIQYTIIKVYIWISVYEYISISIIKYVRTDASTIWLEAQATGEEKQVKRSMKSNGVHLAPMTTELAVSKRAWWERCDLPTYTIFALNVYGSFISSYKIWTIYCICNLLYF